MRKLIVAEHISLDGVIQAPGAREEDPSGDFRLGGWAVPYTDKGHRPSLAGPVLAAVRAAARASYLRHMGTVLAARAGRFRQHAIADLFNSVPKHVATHRPDSLDWQNSHALKGDLADAIRALKQPDGANLLAWGGGEMLRQLLAAGLVDELRLLIYPVVLGRGKRLFDDNAQASALALAHSISTPTGVLITRYVRTADVRTERSNSSSRESQ